MRKKARVEERQLDRKENKEDMGEVLDDKLSKFATKQDLEEMVKNLTAKPAASSSTGPKSERVKREKTEEEKQKDVEEKERKDEEKKSRKAIAKAKAKAEKLKAQAKETEHMLGWLEDQNGR